MSDGSGGITLPPHLAKEVLKLDRHMREQGGPIRMPPIYIKNETEPLTISPAARKHLERELDAMMYIARKDRKKSGRDSFFAAYADGMEAATLNIKALLADFRPAEGKMPELLPLDRHDPDIEREANNE